MTVEKTSIYSNILYKLNIWEQNQQTPAIGCSQALMSGTRENSVVKSGENKGHGVSVFRNNEKCREH